MEELRLKRKMHIVDRRFQYRTVAMFLVLVILAVGLFVAGAAIVFWVFSSLGGSAAEAGALRISQLLPVLLLEALIVMVLLAVFGVLYSHRIAGPVYRMECDIERVLCGEQNVEIRLRRFDQFQNLARKVNRLIREIDGLRLSAATPPR